MKTCLVGCGGIAAVHGSVLTSGIDTEFVAAADIKPKKRRLMRKISIPSPIRPSKACLKQKNRMSCISAHRTICTFQ